MLRFRLAVLALATTALTPGARAAPDFGPCDAAIAAERSITYEHALCYYRAAGQVSAWPEASARLEALARAHPGTGWFDLVQGFALGNQGEAAARDRFHDAAAQFRAARELRGELLARANLRIMLYAAGDVAGATKQVQRIREIGSLSADPQVQVRALVAEGRHLLDTNTDLDLAYDRLKRAEAALAEARIDLLRHEVLNELGQLNARFGRLEEAVSYFRQLDALASANDNALLLALARTNLASVLHEWAQNAPADVPAKAVGEAATGALEAARRAQLVPMELAALRLLAEVEAQSDPSRASAYAQECLRSADEPTLRWPLAECRMVLAYTQALIGSPAAMATIEQALNTMQSAADGAYANIAFAWRYLMRISWLTATPEEAARQGLRALTAFETLRSAQPSAQARSAVFATWTRDYRWLAGNVLSASAGPEAVADAFGIMERMRARGLFEALRGGAAPSPGDAELEQRIVELNRQLMRRNAPASSAALLDELAAIERRERLARIDAPLAAFDATTIAEVQQHLRADEAMLSFLIDYASNPLDPLAPGAWLFVLTRETARAYPLPSRPELDGVAQLLQAFRGPARQFAAAAHSAFRRLLAEPLAEIDSTVTRLIIVPDSPLNAFPFANLSDTREFRSLAASYTLTMTPSAAAWVHWRAGRDAPRTARAPLAVVNPVLNGLGADGEALLIWRDSEPVRLSDLPAADAEAQALRRQLPDTVTWHGADSSEHALKQATFKEHGILHLAAHAVLDDRFAERSALVLAPGSADEDGLLQSREIARLGLDGQLVVLASCQSATGADMAGEGVMSLARAFLVAGAGAVLGSLWPIRDDHAAAFFDVFYSAIAAGAPAATALQEAQRALIARDFPAQAWAGYVLLGDGEWHEPAVVHATLPWLWLLAALVCALPVVAYFVSRASRPRGAA